MVLYMIPSPAHETPLEWVGSPRNTPLPCILLVFGASWHIHPCNAHTKVKFPTYDRFLHTHTDIYIYISTIYIYIIPYIPLINHLAISYACILPIYYLHAIYLLSMRFLHKTYILSKYYLEAIYIPPIYYLYAIYILSYISTTYLISILSYVFCIFHMCIYIYNRERERYIIQ